MAIGAAVALLVALVAAALVVVASRNEPGGRDEGRAGDRPLQPTANQGPGRGKAGPNLAVDPSDEDHIVELHQELASGDCEFNASFDRGRTWKGGRLVAPAGFLGQPGKEGPPCPVTGSVVGNIGQQSLAFGSGRNVYVSWASTPAPDAVGSTVLLSRSIDGGATFAPAVRVPGMIGGAPPAPDFLRPEVVVDRRTPVSDRLYIAARNAVSNQAMVVRSDDGGSTWTAPVEMSRSSPVENRPPTFPAPEAAHTGATTASTAGDAYINATELTQPVLGPAPPGGGERPLHVGWVAVGRGTRCPPSCETLGETAVDGYLVVASSADGGRTWARTRAVNLRGVITPDGIPFRGSSFPRMAGGPDGALYLAFNQGPGTPGSANCGPGPYPAGTPGAGTTPCPAYADTQTFKTADHSISPDADVWFLRSPDGGTTWSDLKQVNDPKRPGLAAPEITQTRHPQIAVANGRIDIVWEDRRHWYLSPSVRRTAGVGGATAGLRCVTTHASCEEARLGDTYYAGSADGGLTFGPNRRLNDRSHNNDVGFDFRLSTYRDYGPAAAAVGATGLLVADMDSRLGSAATNSLDLFLREVDLRGPAGPLPVDEVAPSAAPRLSVALSERAHPGGAEAVLAAEAATRPATGVVIVNEADPPAALAGAVLARAGLGPVLASPAAGLPALLKAEVGRLGPVRAYLLGDSTRLAPTVHADLAAAGVPADRITRISGVAPPDLAAAVARALDARTPDEKGAVPPLPAFDAAVIVNPASASASSAAALAANRRLPVLFVEAGEVPPATRAALTDLGITRTVVVGGVDVVGAAVETSLPNPERLGGDDRYAVSGAVVQASLARGLAPNVVYVADGAEPMHAALLGGAVARLGGLLLLAPQGDPQKAEAALGSLGLLAKIDRLVTSDLTGTAASAN